MFVRNLLVSAVLVPAEGVASPTDDDVTLLSSGSFELSDEYLMAAAGPLMAAPEMALVQVDMAESLMSFFHSDEVAAAKNEGDKAAADGAEAVDLVPADQPASGVQVPSSELAAVSIQRVSTSNTTAESAEKVSTVVDAQAEAAVSREPTDVAMVQMSATASIDPRAEASMLATESQTSADATTAAATAAALNAALMSAMVRTLAIETATETATALKNAGAWTPETAAALKSAMLQANTTHSAADLAMLQTIATESRPHVTKLTAVSASIEAKDMAEDQGALDYEAKARMEAEMDEISTKAMAVLETVQRHHKDVKIINPHPLFAPQSKFTMGTKLVARQIEAELQLPEAPKDKRGLALLTALVLPAFFGVDRCYMGQYLLGTLKGLTFGGCAVWALLDWCYVMYSCIMETSVLNFFLWRGNFSESSQYGAFYIALFGLLAAGALTVWSPDRGQAKV